MSRRGDNRSNSERDRDAALARERFKAKTAADMAEAKYLEGKSSGGGAGAGAASSELMKNPYFAKAFADASNSIVGIDTDGGRWRNQYATAQGLKAMGASGMERDKALFDERMPENQKFMTEQETSRMNARVPVETEKISDAGATARFGMQHGLGGSIDRGYQADERMKGNENEVRKYGYDIEHGQGGSRDRGYESEKGIWSMRSAAEQAAQEEIARQKMQAGIYESVFSQTQDPNKAAEAARAFGVQRKPSTDYSITTLQERGSPQQQAARSAEADSLYQKHFGGQQAAVSPQQAVPQQMAQAPQPQSLQQMAPKTGFLPALRNSFNQFGVDTANPLRLLDEKLFGKKKPQASIYR